MNAHAQQACCIIYYISCAFIYYISLLASYHIHYILPTFLYLDLLHINYIVSVYIFRDKGSIYSQKV